MKIIFTESQINKIIFEDVNIHYDDEQIIDLIKQSENLINEGKKFIGTYFGKYMSLSVNEIISNPSDHIRTVEMIKKIHDQLHKRFNILYNSKENLYDVQPDNPLVSKFDISIGHLDIVQDDLDTVRDRYESLVDLFVDYDGKIKDNIVQFEKLYPAETINV